MTTIFKGQAAQFTVAVQANGAPVAIPTGATVTAQLFTVDGSQSLAASRACASTDAGADWGNGVVAVAFTSGETDALALGDVMLVLTSTAGFAVKRFKVTVESATAPVHSSLFVRDFIVDELRQDRLMLASQTFFAGVTLSDDYLWNLVRTAEAEIAHELRVPLVPTKFFPLAPSSDVIAALGNMPWAIDPGYDYEEGMFMPDRWGFIRMKNKPLISIDKMQLDFPTVGQSGYADIPAEWLRIDKKYGEVRLVPSTPVLFSASGTFAMMALTGYQMVPQMVKLTYTAGLEDANRDYPDLIDAIKKLAVLKAVQDGFIPQSGSISADGLSQSMSVDVAKYRDTINEILFGPPGANGGLLTSIHGVRSVVL